MFINRSGGGLLKLTRILGQIKTSYRLKKETKRIQSCGVRGHYCAR